MNVEHDHYDDISQLAAHRHHDPGQILGLHNHRAEQVIRSLVPGAVTVRLADTGTTMHRLHDSDIFEWRGPHTRIHEPFRIEWSDDAGRLHVTYEPYSFQPQISEYDLYLFGSGNHHHVYRILGAHFRTVAGVEGVLFATWAPNAAGLSVVGDFNNWDNRCHPMRIRGNSGVWELFIPGVPTGSNYKFEIYSLATGRRLLKSDPYGRQYEMRPATSSILVEDSSFAWQDREWINNRQRVNWMHAPLSVYELHLGSWQRDEHGGFLNYREIADRLVPYIRGLGFTHIELMPVAEHPFDGSWGYQSTGFYAPTSRFGTPDDFRYMVDACHRNGIGVILDWVAGHFPKDAHGISRFDDTALYEHNDPRRGEHPEWGTLIFNYSRHEVRNFLIANAFYWIEEFHLDGLRVDAVASMLYLDYSRKPGEWVPNEHGGNENLEAIDFLRTLNSKVLLQHPDVLIIAEESTSWPQVTRPAWLGGLGFNMKWNMGWMHDTLGYMSMDPIHRHFHHENLTFGLLYAFHENFVLPLSHDEVVYGKRSMLAKMPGDDWQRFANLRLLYTYMFTYPGKKLLFMGNEFGQSTEWDHDAALLWELLNQPRHGTLSRLLTDLNGLYRNNQALHFYDFQQEGFEWIDCHDNTQSVVSYLRRSRDRVVIVVLNFTPIPRHNYRLGVPETGHYRELLNSDSAHYGGSNVGNLGGRFTDHKPWMGKTCSLVLDLPPLGGLILEKSDDMRN